MAMVKDLNELYRSTHKNCCSTVDPKPAFEEYLEQCKLANRKSHLDSLLEAVEVTWDNLEEMDAEVKEIDLKYPLRRGYWECYPFPDEEDSEYDPRCRCSACGNIHAPYIAERYCPYCGAFMRG